MYQFVFGLLQNLKLESVTANGNYYPEPKTISTENGSLETEDKDVVLEGLGSVGIYDQWVAPSVSGHRPKARYEVIFFFSVPSNSRHGTFLHLECLICMYFYAEYSHSLQHGAALIQEKMYIFGGNHNGRYLNDLQV